MTKTSNMYWLLLGLTLILVGYFLPWLSHPASGLTLIGLDISEWTKFMPQMGSGELPHRDLFYVPPITLGICLALCSVGQTNGWRPWLLRGLALLVAFISFPSIDAIRFEPSGEWRPRLILIGVVLLFALAAVWLDRLPQWVVNLLLGLTAGVGFVLPTYLFWVLLPVLESWLVLDFQIGWGLWLNGVGHLLVAGMALWTISPNEA